MEMAESLLQGLFFFAPVDIRGYYISYYGEKTKEEFIMGTIKNTIKLLVALDKLNQELNDGLNERIRELKKQVKEEEKNPRSWRPGQ